MVEPVDTRMRLAPVEEGSGALAGCRRPGITEVVGCGAVGVGCGDGCGQATAVVDASGHGASIVSAGTPDGVSTRVTVSDVWHPPLVSMFVPDGEWLEATETSRRALQ